MSDGANRWSTLWAGHNRRKGAVEITGTMKGRLNRSNGRFVLHCIAQY